MPDFHLLPKQMQFVREDAPEVMYSGAVRAGKTYALCAKLYGRANRPGARELLVRKTMPALKATTLQTLIHGDGQTPPIIPPGSYVHNKTDHTIKFNNGGEIVYLSLVNDGDGGTQQRIGSYSATGVAGDEATEYDHQDYRMLLSRASVTVKGLPKQCYWACNPGSPSHFLADRFAPPGSGKSKPLSGCVCIPTYTRENFFLSKDYLDMLDRDKGTLWYRRFVEGLWVGAEGLVYDRWDRQIHVQTRNERFARYVVGVDDGYTNPFCALLAGVDGDGRVHVLREFYRSGLLVGARVSAIQDTALGCGVDAVMVDPSSPDLIAEVKSRGLSVVGANNDVVPGINAVQGRLAVLPDGRPRLTVDPSCENLIREMETYQWKPNKPKDEPVKAHDHACDALRYLIARLDLSAPFFAMTVGERGEELPIADRLASKSVVGSFTEAREADPDWGFDA